ncbi:MAG: hypothetical protein Q7P63_03135 [Verrucomicrobiota bacterium JB022]|nr:hypothetical protein [Verrucomicrobiota bacterium JB022]
MIQQSLQDSLESLPGLEGYVHCGPAGEIQHVDGREEAELLGLVMPYLQQVTQLIGGSIGLEGLYEIQAGSPDFRTVVVPLKDGMLGLLLNPRSRTEEILQHLSPYTL